MYVFENPVLQRELLVNLRTNRAFVSARGLSTAAVRELFCLHGQLTQVLDLTTQSAVRQAAGRPVLSRTVRHRLIDGPQFCCWRHHW